MHRSVVLHIFEINIEMNCKYVCVSWGAFSTQRLPSTGIRVFLSKFVMNKRPMKVFCFDILQIALPKSYNLNSLLRKFALIFINSFYHLRSWLCVCVWLKSASNTYDGFDETLGIESITQNDHFTISSMFKEDFCFFQLRNGYNIFVLNMSFRIHANIFSQFHWKTSFLCVCEIIIKRTMVVAITYPCISNNEPRRLLRLWTPPVLG